MRAQLLVGGLVAALTIGVTPSVPVGAAEPRQHLAAVVVVVGEDSVEPEPPVEDAAPGDPYPGEPTLEEPAPPGPSAEPIPVGPPLDDHPPAVTPAEDPLLEDPVADEEPPAATDLAAVAERAAQRQARESARIQAIGLRELAAAEAELASRESELADARARESMAEEAVRQAAAAREAAGDEVFAARRDLGNLARLAYTSGPSDLTLVASLLDAESPSDALRRATVAQLVAEHQEGQFDNAVAVLRGAEHVERVAAGEIAAAAAEVAAVEERVRTASEWVADLRRALGSEGIATRDGVRLVAQACRVRPEDPRCLPSPWGEAQLTRDAVWLMRTVRDLWPQIEVVGGYRATDPYPDHPMGRAVDIMVPQAGRTDGAVELGDEIAAELTEHAAEHGVMYVIWRQRVWVAGKDPVAPPSRWRLMGDRGGWTVNHMDHLHVTVSTGVSGSDIYDHLVTPPD